MTHPQDLTLREQAAAIRGGDLDPCDLLNATVARIVERDGALNSTPIVFADNAAEMLERVPDGPLRGVPLTVKDMFALPWRGAHNGTPVELIPAASSGPFRRLQSSGAVVVGLANQHELGMGSTGTVSVYGPIHNPWDLGCCAGGSSSGSAAAVAGRLVAGSLGSDSGGSTRLPASWCGVVGLKLTYGVVPYDGYFGMGTTFSAPGVFGRDAEDTRLLTEALLGHPVAHGDAGGLRVGIIRDPFWSDTDPGVRTSCQDALSASGWSTVDIGIDHLELAGAAAMARLLAEAGSPRREVLAAVSKPTRALLLAAMLMPARLVPAADRVRAAVRRAVADAFATVDLLAWPATAAPAPPLEDPWISIPSGRLPADLPNVRQASLANLCGLPGISVPTDPHPCGLPVGLQLLAPWGEEGRLLDAAEHLQRATGRASVDRQPPTGAGSP